MEISGDYRLGEATDEEAQKAGGQGEEPGWVFWLFWGFVLACVIGGVSVASLVLTVTGLFGEDGPMLAASWGSVLGGLMGLQVARRERERWHQRRLEAQGWEPVSPMRVAVTSGGLVVACGPIETRAEWRAVRRLTLAGRFWVVDINGSQTWIPRRFFAAPELERSFIAAMLARMAPEAAAASPEAVRAAALPDRH